MKFEVDAIKQKYMESLNKKIQDIKEYDQREAANIGKYKKEFRKDLLIDVVISVIAIYFFITRGIIIKIISFIVVALGLLLVESDRDKIKESKRVIAKLANRSNSVNK